MVVYDEHRGTHLGSRVTKNCNTCKVHEHYGYWTRSGKRQFEDTAVGLSLMVTSRFVPMDLSYPDDSYPGSDISYPLWINPMDDSYPTIYDTFILSLATNSSSLRKLKRMQRSTYREVQRPLFEVWEAFKKKEKSLKQLFNDSMIKNSFFCDF